MLNLCCRAKWLSFLYICIFIYIKASLVAQLVKNLPTMRETWVRSLDCEDPLEKGVVTYSSILVHGESHGQRSLAVYSPWGHKESDTTEQLSTFLHIHIHSFSYFSIRIYHRVLNIVSCAIQ